MNFISFIKSKPYFTVAIVALVGFVVLIYSNHFDNPFEFDDSHSIVNNLYIRDLGNIGLFFTDASTSSSFPPNQAYRPLLTLSTAVDYWLAGGLNPIYFHASTFILFLIQGIFIFLLFQIILKKTSNSSWLPWATLFATAWYMVHTVNAETINYIYQRADSISTFMVVLSLYMFAKGGRSRKFLLYLIPFMIGMLIKRSTLMFIPILWAYIFLFEDDKSLIENIKSGLKNHLSHLLIASFLGIGFSIFIASMNVAWVPGGTDRWHYLMTQPFVLKHYFQMFFLPLELSADTDWVFVQSFDDYRFLSGLFFIGILIGITFFTAKAKILRPISFGLIWFFAALIPTSSIIPLAELMNDHRMFFPFVGLMLSVVWTISLIIMKFEKEGRLNSPIKTLIPITALLIIIAYGYGTYVRNEVWGSPESLWRDVTIKSPKNGRGHMNYGLALMRRGHFSGAIKSFTTGLKFNPTYAYLHLNLGIAYNAIKEEQKSSHHYNQALNLSPELPEISYWYGKWLYDKKQLEKAKLFFIKAIEQSPAHLQARNTLMDLYRDQNNFTELKLLGEETLNYSPKNKKALNYITLVNYLEGDSKSKVPILSTAEEYLNLSLSLYQKGDFHRCILVCQTALKINPNYAEAYNNICSAYNMLQQWEKAKAACGESLKIKPGNELAINNLAWAISQIK